MRRPAKPFVTEYKGSGRRGKDSRGEADAVEIKPRAAEARATGRASGGRSAEQRGSLPPRGLFRGAEEAEPIDSYEAAMRAADALFSPRARPERPDDASENAAPTTTARNDVAAAGQPEPAGRVLRALDEPAPPPVEPVAEAAPTRRGRGARAVSRPKADAKSQGTARPRLAKAAQTSSSGPGAEADATEPVMPGPVDRPVHAEALPPLPAAVPLARRRDRFPWVRTKLRPGEKWKRRLPKVAW